MWLFWPSEQHTSMMVPPGYPPSLFSLKMCQVWENYLLDHLWDLSNSSLITRVHHRQLVSAEWNISYAKGSVRTVLGAIGEHLASQPSASGTAQSWSKKTGTAAKSQGLNSGQNLQLRKKFYFKLLRGYYKQ